MTASTKTITIGIPAYNEEKNIGKLLENINMQKLHNLRIEEIIVLSDGSNDNTVKIAKSALVPRLKVIDRKSRLGTNRTLNQIINLASGDILVILNADVSPISNIFLENLVSPILKDKNVGLVGGNVIGVIPKKLFEQIIYLSHNLKMDIGKKIKKGDNVYMCYGGSRALSKDNYSKLHFHDNLPEDAYSYFDCLKKGFKFVFAENAKVKIRLPGTFNDHAKQSMRASAGRRELEYFFGKSITEKVYFIPKTIYLKSITKFLLINPILMFSYLFITFLLRNLSKRKKFNSRWEIAESTKNLL